MTIELQGGLGTPERPIESSTEDRLERDQFVRRLASALIDPKTKKSRGVVIGITGPWGSGKSSILNLLRERLKAGYPDAVVVSFDPWLVSGRNDLISEFINGQHPVNSAATLFRGSDRGRRLSVRPLVGNDLFQALDAIFGEGCYAILTDAVDVQAAVFREHVAREFVQPVLIFAEHFGDVVDGEDGCDSAQGQAA